MSIICEQSDGATVRFVLCVAGLLGYAALDAESEQRRPVADPGELAAGESAAGATPLPPEPNVRPPGLKVGAV